MTETPCVWVGMNDYEVTWLVWWLLQLQGP